MILNAYFLRVRNVGYMNAIEEIINVNDILKAFNVVVRSNLLQSVMDEIINQSKVEFNYDEDD